MVLRQHYFWTEKDETLDAIINFTQNREKNDNILIYYAGHGQLNKKTKKRILASN